MRKIMNVFAAKVGQVFRQKNYFDLRISIQNTLQQVGTPQIKKHVENRGFRFQAKEKPMKGIFRLIIRK